MPTLCDLLESKKQAINFVGFFGCSFIQALFLQFHFLALRLFPYFSLS